MQWLKSNFTFHCACAIYHCSHFALTSFLQVHSVFTPSHRVIVTLSTLTTVLPLLFCGSLFSLTSHHSYFLIILDSVSYLNWIITVIKNQKLFSTKNYQLAMSVKWKCIVFKGDTCLWYKI